MGSRNYFVLFLLSFLIAFGGGYLYFKPSDTGNVAQPSNPTAPAQPQTQEPVKPEKTAETAEEGRIFIQRGCVSCHSISALNIQGGATGPDLSKAFENVEGKHGVPLEQYLQKPTSAVMSGVLGSKPLTDEERKAVLAGLEAASKQP